MYTSCHIRAMRRDNRRISWNTLCARVAFVGLAAPERYASEIVSEGRDNTFAKGFRRMAAMDLIDTIMGKREGDPPKTPQEVVNPLHKRHHTPAHPIVGDMAPPSPPPGPTIEQQLIEHAQRLHHVTGQVTKLASLVETLAEIQRVLQARNVDTEQSVVIGPNQPGALVVRRYGRPYVRVWVSSYNAVTVAVPGQGTTGRELVPGWNTLDMPEGTRIWSASGATINATLTASYAPTMTPQAVAVAGYVDTSRFPAQTNVGADTLLIFSAPVGHWVIQNNTAAAVGYETETAATIGSLQIPAGQMVSSDIPLAALHLFTAAAQNINGSAAGNIVIRGWL